MSAIQKAQTAWGDELPDWVHALATECSATSQKATAGRIGYSPAVVNTVLARTYKGDLTAVQQAVEGALLSATVMCPVAGDIPANVCLEYQRRPLVPTNSQRVRMFRACRNGCRHSRHK